MQQNIFPNKIILVVTSHGSISYPLEYFQLPLNYTSLNIASLGECNFSNTSDINKHLSTIQTVVPNLLNASSEEEYKDIYEFIITNILEHDKSQHKYWFNGQLDANDKNYLYAFNNNRVIKFGKGDETILDKTFSRYPKTKKDGDYSVIALNAFDINGQMIDMFDWMERQNRNKEQNILLSEILYELVTYGVDEVVLIDLSCDVFFNEIDNDFVTPRQKRNIRYSLRRENKIGKGGRKTKNNPKTKKNKKKRRPLCISRNKFVS